MPSFFTNCNNSNYITENLINKTHPEKSFSIFPSPAGMSLTKLSLGGNNDVINKLFPPRESLAGDGNIAKLFLRCIVLNSMPPRGILFSPFQIAVFMNKTYIHHENISIFWKDLIITINFSFATILQELKPYSRGLPCNA